MSGDRWLWEWIGDRCLIYFLGVAIANPLKVEIQADGRMRCWAKIEENDGRYLRVILLEDGETVHNAFFDRNFKELET